MAKRPWITPHDVKAYTDIELIKNRSPEKFKVDIMRAEQYVINYTGNSFSDDNKYPQIPDPVRIAVILIAEVFAYNASTKDENTGIKSESFDDYSYTLFDSTELSLSSLNLGDLLDEFCDEGTTRGKINLKIRRL